MNIFPLHAEEARKRHWVVRTLRYFGYLDAIAGIIVGIVYGNVGLPFWGLALIADALHALRIYASGMVVLEDRQKNLAQN